jgi:hypothetical protein
MITGVLTHIVRPEKISGRIFQVYQGIASFSAGKYYVKTKRYLSHMGEFFYCRYSSEAEK